MVIPISDASDPRIAPYTGLRDAHAREQHLTLAEPASGTFIAEGDLVVRQLIASGLAVQSLLMTPVRHQAMADALAALGPAVPIYLAERPVLNAIAGFNIHRGVLAHGERPPPPDEAGLLRTARALVILEDLTNHDNVGGIFRATAALAGLPGPQGAPAAVLLSPRCADPYYRKAIRVSMGTVLRLPSATLAPWPAALDRVRQAGFTPIALTPASECPALDHAPAVVRPALLLGAEGPGLSPAALAACQMRLRIPIDPRVDSLNVVTAAAIALHRLIPRP